MLLNYFLLPHNHDDQSSRPTELRLGLWPGTYDLWGSKRFSLCTTKQNAHLSGVRPAASPHLPGGGGGITQAAGAESDKEPWQGFAVINGRVLTPAPTAPTPSYTFTQEQPAAAFIKAPWHWIICDLSVIIFQHMGNIIIEFVKDEEIILTR